MENLPVELLDMILLEYMMGAESKNVVLETRLTCRAFDRSLKPRVCHALKLDLWRMTRTRKHGYDGLQTIGDVARALHLEFNIVRDSNEIHHLESQGILPRTYCSNVRSRFCMGPGVFDEQDLASAIHDMLFYCRSIDTMLVTLPHALTFDDNVGTVILIIALKVLANDSDNYRHHHHDDNNESRHAPPPPLKNLIIDNLLPSTVATLWCSRLVIANWKTATRGLRHLMMRVNLADVYYLELRRKFPHALWAMIGCAAEAETLCLSGCRFIESYGTGLRVVRRTAAIRRLDWESDLMPGPAPGMLRGRLLSNLRTLELRDLALRASMFARLCAELANSLEELFLIELRLKIAHRTQSATSDDDPNNRHLWVGLPNRRPPEGAVWLAMAVRTSLPRLKLCRASNLDYDVWLGDGDAATTDYAPTFDYNDPCGLGRSVAYRFVEVVMGIRQPPLRPATRRDPEEKEKEEEEEGGHASKSDSSSVTYLPSSSDDDERLMSSLTDRKNVGVENWNALAYQVAVRNPTSRWVSSLDGCFECKSSLNADLASLELRIAFGIHGHESP